jgi:hypothetical protein
MASGPLRATFSIGITARGALPICTEVQHFPEAAFGAVTTAKQSHGSGHSPNLWFSSERET